MKASTAGFLQVAALLAALCFVLGLFGRLHWQFDLCSHFRAQYAATLLISGIGLLVLRNRKSGISALLGGIVVAGALLVPFPHRAAAAPGAPRMKIVSFNVNTANLNRAEVLRFLEAQNADVIFLMEVNDAWLASLQPLDVRYPHRLAASRGDNFGIAVYSKQPFQGGLRSWGGDDLPWAELVFPDNQPTLTLVALHPLPPSGEENSSQRNRQLLEIASMKRDSSRTVFLGDLNLTPYSPWFPEILRLGTLDNPAPPYSPTWMRHYPLFAIPIDHVLLGSGLALASREVGPSLGSDHCPLIVEVAAKQ